MSELVALKASLDRVDKTLALLIEISEEKTPQLKRDILEIAGTVLDGFHMEQLTEQARRSINTAINQSELKKLQQDVNESSEKIKSAVYGAQQSFDNAKNGKGFRVALLSGVVCFAIGVCLMWMVQYNRIEAYQSTVSWLDNPKNNAINKTVITSSVADIFEYFKKGGKQAELTS